MKKTRDYSKTTMQVRNAGALFGVAVNAARSIKADDRAGGQQPALTSIIFSVISVEAFLNEAADLALDFDCPSDPAASLFSEYMGDAEKSHASLESKLVFSHWILTKQKLDRGSQPFQDFRLLTGVRNDLVHFKATDPIVGNMTPEEVHKELLDKFKAKKILAENYFLNAPWTFLIQTKAVAGWACETASRVVVDFFEKIPTGSWKNWSQTFVEGFADTGMHPNRVEYWPLNWNKRK